MTPLFGAGLAAHQLERVEAEVPGVRCVRLSPEGHVHGDAASALADAEVMLRGAVSADVFDHVLARAPRLRWVHSASAGVEKVATPLARQRGLVVTNARGVFSTPIAEYVVLMLLALARRLPQLLELQRERTWQPLRGTELRDWTVGILGYGSIGAEVARLLRPFGPAIMATRRHPERGAEADPNVTLLPGGQTPELLAASDAVVLTAPLTDETRGMIGARALQQMKESAYLLNVSRGQLVDEVALRRALESGWIAGAVLDVFGEEPLPADSPLYRTRNLIITPHTSWNSDRAIERSLELFIANLRRYTSGEPLANLVDLEAGY